MIKKACAAALILCMTVWGATAQTHFFVPDESSGRNLVKLNLTNLLLKSFAVQYDRVLAPGKTVGLAVNYRPKNEGPFAGMYDAAYDQTPTGPNYALANSQTSYLNITPNLRFFVKRKAPRGFYFETYLRYEWLSRDFNFRSYDYSGNSIDPLVVGTGNSQSQFFGAGGMIGYQVMLGRKIALDFWFVGLHLGYMHTKTTGNSHNPNMTTADEEEIQTDLSGITRNATLQWVGTAFTGIQNGPAADMRLLGINLGIAF